MECYILLSRLTVISLIFQITNAGGDIPDLADIPKIEDFSFEVEGLNSARRLVLAGIRQIQTWLQATNSVIETLSQ